MSGQCARPFAIWGKFSFPLAAIHAKMPRPKSTFSTGLALESARLMSWSALWPADSHIQDARGTDILRLPQRASVHRRAHAAARQIGEVEICVNLVSGA